MKLNYCYEIEINKIFKDQILFAFFSFFFLFFWDIFCNIQKKKRNMHLCERSQWNLFRDFKSDRWKYILWFFIDNDVVRIKSGHSSNDSLRNYESYSWISPKTSRSPSSRNIADKESGVERMWNFQYLNGDIRKVGRPLENLVRRDKNRSDSSRKNILSFGIRWDIFSTILLVTRIY